MVGHGGDVSAAAVVVVLTTIVVAHTCSEEGGKHAGTRVAGRWGMGVTRQQPLSSSLSSSHARAEVAGGQQSGDERAKGTS